MEYNDEVLAKIEDVTSALRTVQIKTRCPIKGFKIDECRFTWVGEDIEESPTLNVIVSFEIAKGEIAKEKPISKKSKKK